jgi:DNA polymerase
MSEAHGEMDFETYSEAGYIWDETTQKFHAPKGARRKGLFAVNTSVYTEHPSAEVLTFSYRFPGEDVKRRWRPGLPNPQDLFDFLASGGVMEAHKAMFERLVWENICVPKYGWPPLNPYQLRCSMAKARVVSLPGALADLSKVLKLPIPKDADGKRLLDKFSGPRNPTKNDPRRRIFPPHMVAPPPPGLLESLTPARRAARDRLLAEDAVDFDKLQGYCDTDLDAERGASSRTPDMTADELNFWFVDQEINHRGLGIDRAGVRACIVILDLALAQYGDECRELTGGLDPTQLAAIKSWLEHRNVFLPSMDEETVDATLARMAPHPPHGYDPRRRVLEIRQLIGSASVKKLYRMENEAGKDDRLHDLIVHHGARTGRPTGESAQPLNMPRAGPKLARCGPCNRPFQPTLDACPWCGSKVRATDPDTGKELKPAWKPDMIDHVLEIMATGSLELVEFYFGDALLCISGCLRGLFVAAPGHELIASDYSAIEAVVTAMLAGEEWRIEVFRAVPKKDIYLVSAAKITGRSEEFYAEYAAANGDNHEDRQKIGKVAELAMGFGGWLGAWRAFDSTDNFTDGQVEDNIKAWRAASPKIVDLWGGQRRKTHWGEWVPELYGFEGAAIRAIQTPGEVFSHAGIQFFMRGHKAAEPEAYIGVDGQQHVRWVGGAAGALIVRLLSGRELTYHSPSLTPSTRRYGELAIVYWTWNTNPKYGPMGWVPMNTFGGRLTENIVQATAHDILRFAILNLRAAGYPTVLHVYDEIVVEVPVGVGTIEEVERIMATLPWWCHGWPVFAAGGWRAKRYRKG